MTSAVYSTLVQCFIIESWAVDRSVDRAVFMSRILALSNNIPLLRVVWNNAKIFMDFAVQVNNDTIANAKN